MKALIGNSAYRRNLRTTSDRHTFEIDPDKLADKARCDGFCVLRTNARLTAVLRTATSSRSRCCSASPEPCRGHGRSFMPLMPPSAARVLLFSETPQLPIPPFGYSDVVGLGSFGASCM